MKKCNFTNPTKEKIEELTNSIIKTKRMLGNLCYLLFILLFVVVGSFLVFPNLGKNIDEGKFCLDKLVTYFSEYPFDNAQYSNSDNTCWGYYDEKIMDGKSEIRDGLELLPQEVSTTRETKTFQLLYQEEINYLGRDDWPNTLIGLGYFLWFCASMTIMIWAGERGKF